MCGDIKPAAADGAAGGNYTSGLLSSARLTDIPLMSEGVTI